MDTLSRDSNNSGSILPLVGVIAGGLALILSVVSLYKLTAVQKGVAANTEQIEQKLPALESEIQGAKSKAETDLKGMRDGVQSVLTSVGESIGAINARMTKIEEAQKARAVAPAGKGGAAAAPTGVLGADGMYAVAPGDTLSRIAKKFAVKVDAIEAENPGLQPAKLKVGQKIKIPKK